MSDVGYVGDISVANDAKGGDSKFQLAFGNKFSSSGGLLDGMSPEIRLIAVVLVVVVLIAWMIKGRAK